MLLLNVSCARLLPFVAWEIIYNGESWFGAISAVTKVLVNKDPNELSESFVYIKPGWEVYSY